MNRILIIARNTFREAVRDRVLYNLVLFVLLITAGAIFLGELTAGHEVRTIINLGLSAMLLFGAFIAIFVGVGLVSKEIEKRTVYVVLSKPIGRGEFIVGKYLGLCLTLFVNVLVMGIGISLAVLAVGGGDFAFTVWGAIALIYLELIVLTAVAILFSSFSSPALSALLAFFVFVIGHFSLSLKEFARGLGSWFSRTFFDALYYGLPNLSFFSFNTGAAHGSMPESAHLLGAFLYALVYSGVLITAASLIFSRRNFK